MIYISHISYIIYPRYSIYYPIHVHCPCFFSKEPQVHPRHLPGSLVSQPASKAQILLQETQHLAFRAGRPPQRCFGDVFWGQTIGDFSIKKQKKNTGKLELFRVSPDFLTIQKKGWGKCDFREWGLGSKLEQLDGLNFENRRNSISIKNIITSKRQNSNLPLSQCDCTCISFWGWLQLIFN